MRAKLLSIALLLAFSSLALGQGNPCDSPEAAKSQENVVLAARGYDTALIAVRACLGSLKGDAAPVVFLHEREG